MKKKTFVVQTFLISLLVVALVLTSCEFGIKLAEESDNEGLVTPYTNMSNLSIARSVADEADPDIVNWKVARFFALIEKIDFESVYPWHGAKVSEYPVVIYYADSNKPRYYEFRVIKNGVEIGSITCNASKSEGMPVAYVSEMAHKVTAETAKKLVNLFGGAKLATVNYPTQFVLRDSTTTARSVIEGETAFKDALTGEAIKPEQAFIERRVDEFLNQADKESLAKLEITPEAKAEMLAEAEEFDADMKVMWDGLEEIMPNILAVTDEEVEREYKNPDAIITETARHIYKRETTYEDNMLYDWVNKKNWGPYNISMWCGPSVVTYIAIGLGERAGCSLIPLIPDNSKAQALYMLFENTIGKGPKVISSLSKGLSAHTNYKIEQKLCHRWKDVNSHITNYHLPVVSLRSGWYGDWGFHYRLIIGTQKETKKEYHKFSWWWGHWRTKYWTKDKYTYWYYMRDNTSDSSKSAYRVEGVNTDFWERSGQVFQSTLGLVKHK